MRALAPTLPSAAQAVARRWREAETAHQLRFRAARWLRNLPYRFGLSERRTDAEIVAGVDGIVTYEGYRFDLSHPRCTSQIGAAVVERTYEQREIDLIRRYVTRGDRVIELGVCLGATTLVLAEIVGRENLLAIEADPRNLALAEAMFALNQLDIRMEHGVLVSGTLVPETISFRSNANPSSSSLAERGGSEITVTVPALSFEEILRREKATCLVLDIEGGEFELFTGATDLGVVEQIIMEAHPAVIGDGGMAELHAALLRFGFRKYRDIERGRFLIYRRGMGRR
jgi:FkbM family methyltransferase